MYDDFESSASAVCRTFTQGTLPRWRELPDLELYMDQVLGLIERYLGSYPGFDGKGLTASMVNNYVKLGIMPAPVKKKYTREHLAHLIIICILKASLPIAEIRQLIDGELGQMPLETLYDRFCEMFELTGQAVADSVSRQIGENSAGKGPFDTILFAALRAQAEQSLSRTLLALAFSED